MYRVDVSATKLRTSDQLEKKSHISRLKNAIAYLVILYTAVAIAGDQFSSKKEWFPVFSWSLFSEVYAYGWATRLEVVSINGRPLAQPAFYRDLNTMFSKADRAPIEFNKLLKQIALDHHHGAPNEGRLRVLRETYLAEVNSIDWRIIRLVTDPIQHYKTREIATRYVWLEGSFPSDLKE